MAQQELTGTIDRCIYYNEENGFAVCILALDKKTTTTVKGYMPRIQPGERVTLQGAWIDHPKFGRQFAVEQCSTNAPTTIDGLKKYLGSGLIKGIGPAYAEKIVNHFGTQTLDVINTDPQLLSSVPGIGKKRIQTIISAWQDQKEIAHVMVFLQEKGVSTAYATKIYKKFGAESIAIVTENPYRLAQEIWGIGFKTADAIAQNLAFEKHSIKRIRAGILFALTEHCSHGHLYCELNALKKKTYELLELQDTDVQEVLSSALHDIYNTGQIRLISYKQDFFVTTAAYYATEYGIAKKIELLQKHPSSLNIPIKKVYQALRVSTQPALHEAQQEGVLTCLRHKVSIITGGPGTGKTTLIRALIQTLDEHNIRYKLAAPTGRAAKRMSESTRKKASTLHRLLAFDVSTFGFTKNEQNALQADIIIVDEASMLDAFLTYALLKAVPRHAHLIFIGDVDQLPSVGSGNVLADMLASGSVAHVRLTHIFRQAQDSMIIVNAHRVNQGSFPIAPLPHAKKDFLFIKEDDPAMVREHLTAIYKKGIGRYGIGAHNTTTLVPMHRGVAGTHNLNHTIQAMLNPNNHSEIHFRGTIFRINDRVMHIRNNYDKQVFNGDIGTIISIDPDEKSMEVQFLEQTVPYAYSELDELQLAYAISIHKSQGSEFDAIIVPIFMQHFMLLKRNLIYTAITRAKKLCIFLGQPKAIGMAINNAKDSKRITFLKQYLAKDPELEHR